MTRHERLSSIVQLVVEQGSVTVDQIIKDLGISAATARRDLDVLADQQLVLRTRGGAMANPTTGEVPLRYRSATQSSAKAAIAIAAAAMLQPGDVVGFNGGTTTTTAAHEIGVRIAADSDFTSLPVTVVTNAVNIANDLTIRPQARVVLTGGVARTQSYELVGPLAELILPHIHLDTLFLGVNAVDLTRGYFTHTEDEAAINAALVAAADRTVILADSSKLHTSAFALICPLAGTTLITDKQAPADRLAALTAAGVDVIVV